MSSQVLAKKHVHLLSFLSFICMYVILYVFTEKPWKEGYRVSDEKSVYMLVMFFSSLFNVLFIRQVQ